MMDILYQGKRVKDLMSPLTLSSPTVGRGEKEDEKI
jgi:hypothetical protein